mmetsp:Transcript_119311/g.283224  ORF Transcript_119311/g.283224 Transcript_119311/m.283224 type:complete len:151 (+) Transcript_119311:76-528(+)
MELNSTVFCAAIVLVLLAMLMPPLLIWTWRRYYPDPEALRLPTTRRLEKSVPEQLESQVSTRSFQLKRCHLDLEVQRCCGEDACWLCVVCMGDLELGSRVRRLPCEHLFHSACVDSWLESHRECPVCRQQAVPEATEWQKFAARTMFFEE